jgi:hypothetical protein
VLLVHNRKGVMMNNLDKFFKFLNDDSPSSNICPLCENHFERDKYDKRHCKKCGYALYKDRIEVWTDKGHFDTEGRFRIYNKLRKKFSIPIKVNESTLEMLWQNWIFGFSFDGNTCKFTDGGCGCCSDDNFFNATDEKNRVLLEYRRDVLLRELSEINKFLGE